VLWYICRHAKTRSNPPESDAAGLCRAAATGGLADGRSYIGDLTLEEERSNEIVVSITSDLDRFSISPQVFFRKVDNYIPGIPSTNMIGNMVSTMMTGAPALQFSNVAAEIEQLRVEARVDNLLDETYQDHLTGINRAMGSDIPVGERLYGAERTISAGVIFSF
jgi:hypothetical protein